MEKENRIPPSRRRPAGSDGPAPTALATQGKSASDDPAGGDAGSGQDEEGLAGDRPGAKHGGIGPAEAVPGPRAPQGQPAASSALPQRVRGMSDGPRPPAQVARPVLPPSFLERVRAAAEAEQRLEQRAQEEARQPTQPEPPAARPAEPRRPPRFVRSRDWKARSDKKDQVRGDQPGPGPQRGTAGDHPGPVREGPAHGGNGMSRGTGEPDQGGTRTASGTPGAGVNGAAEPGRPAALPRREKGVNHGLRPAAQVRPGTAVPPEPMTGDALTEPIPVIRVSPTGEPLPPAGMGGGIPGPDAPPSAAQAAGQPQARADAGQAPAAQAAAGTVAPGKATPERAPAAAKATAPEKTSAPEKAPARHAAAKKAAPGRAAAAKKAPAGPAAEQPSPGQAAAQQAAAQQAARPAGGRAGGGAAG